MAITVSCPTCGTQLPRGSGVCPRCAAVSDTRASASGETVELSADPVQPDPQLKTSPSDRPPSIHMAQREPFGIHPVPLLAGLGVISLLLGIVLLSMGALVSGAVVLILAIALLMLLRFAVRREPEAPLARAIGQGIDRGWSGWELAGLRVRTGLRAAVELARIRARQARLRNQLRGQLRPLGEAVHREDHQRAAVLKQRAREIEQELRTHEGDALAVAEAARRRIRRERAASQPTEVISTPPQ
jgi:hypothetical protein